jgi:DNA-binding NarL/FixJ family response regulator
MPTQRIELAAKQRCFAGHHITHVPHRQAELLVLFAFGLSNLEAADWMGVTAQTVDHHSAEVRQLVVPPEYEATRVNAQFWAVEHRTCCLATWFATFCRGA